MSKQKESFEDRCDKIAMQCMKIVADRTSRDGRLYAYDGIEAARQIRSLLIKKFRRQP